MTDRKLIPCYICETPFPQYRAASKFCSAKCRQKGRKDSDRVQTNCAHCKIKFMPTVSHGKYCSVECREAFKRDRQRRPLQEKTCALCPKVFMPVSGSALYCSFQCKVTARNASRQKYKTSDNGKEKISRYNKNYDRFPDKRAMRNRNLISAYGITIDQFEAMLEQQKGLCAICDKPPPEGMPLFVDHVHDETGRVRKLLCIKCNNLVGNCHESLIILDKAKQYLIDHGVTYDTPESS